MTHCKKCLRRYDDAKCWTLCPHGPLGFGPEDYCPKCDTLATVHGGCRHQQGEPMEKKPLHPAVAHVLKFFSYAHLAPDLQKISKPFGDLAQQVAERAPDNAETTVCLRKLLEAKDSAVRAAL
jgi:hypothetical protein